MDRAEGRHSGRAAAVFQCCSAAGDVAYTMYAALFCTLVIRVLFSFVFGMWNGIGVVGIAWAMVLDWTVKAVMIILRWRGGKWKNHQLID